jgi:hypothetical protein
VGLKAVVLKTGFIFLREGLRHFCLSSFRFFSEKASAATKSSLREKPDPDFSSGARPNPFNACWQGLKKPENI